MIKIGIVSFDTSHSVEFARRINHVGIPEEQWVDGAKVVMGYPGEPTSFANEDIISRRTQQLKDFGVQIVSSPEDMIGKVDAILLEIQEGGSHLRTVKPFIEAGLPIFIDKPFTCNVSDAKRLVEIALSRNVPIFSSSSLRYASEIQNLKSQDIGNILGVDVYGPAYLNPKNPGLFNYGIHGVEMLYSLMGVGCNSVTSIWDEQWEEVVGQWGDGRIGSFRGLRKGVRDYGFTVFGEKKVASFVVDDQYIYRELLKKTIEMFKTKKPPLRIEETIEIIGFIEAALKSSNEGGTRQKIFL